MKAFSWTAAIFILIISCNSDKNGDVVRSQVQFYHRMALGVDPQKNYSDFLALAGYENHPKTAAELYTIARRYIDTVRAKLRVNNVNFIAKDVEKPELYWDSQIWNAQKKYCLIGFTFNFFDTSNIDKTIKLNMITIWKEGEPQFYELQGELNTILNSPVRLSNK